MGAFAGLGKPKFAIPVSKAGGLGILTSHNYRTLTKYEAALEKMEEMKKPYGINFSIAPPGHERVLSTEETYQKYLDVALKDKFEHLKLVSTSAYKGAEIGKRVKEAGKVWLHKCATMKHALSIEKHGPDFIVIVGLEGTGFKNKFQNTTLINMTMANKLFKVARPIAAGGVGDARGFLSCLMMGASAVCLGTLLMIAEECPVSDKYKQKMIDQDPFDEEFYPRIFHMSTKDSPIYSMAVGFMDKVVPVKELIDKLISDSEKILKEVGFKEEVIHFS